MAQHGCLACSRYFATPVALETHLTGKPHKRRLKILQEEPYTIEESLRAAGHGVDNGEGRAKVARVELPVEEMVVEPTTEGLLPEATPAGLVGRLRGAGSALAAMVGIKA